MHWHNECLQRTSLLFFLSVACGRDPTQGLAFLVGKCSAAEELLREFIANDSYLGHFY